MAIHEIRLYHTAYLFLDAYAVDSSRGHPSCLISVYCCICTITLCHFAVVLRSKYDSKTLRVNANFDSYGEKNIRFITYRGTSGQGLSVADHLWKKRVFTSAYIWLFRVREDAEGDFQVPQRVLRRKARV